MWKNLLLSLILYFILSIVEVYRDESEHPTNHNNRLYKFALYQDLLVALSILKMMVIEVRQLVLLVRPPPTALYLPPARSVVEHVASSDFGFLLNKYLDQGYSISGVVQRIRSSGIVTHLYIATSVLLHGSLLFHENTNHQVRLKPVPYDPPTLKEDQKELFLL